MIDQKSIKARGFVKAYEHLLQFSKRHADDVRLSDPLGERKSVMTKPFDFGVSFRGGVGDIDALQAKVHDATRSPGGYVRQQVATRFLVSFSNPAQALLHALPKDNLQAALWNLLEAFDKRLIEEVGDLPRVIVIHTDKCRFHIEVIVLKYMENGVISPGFNGMNKCHTGHVADAVLAAQFGGDYPMWFARARMAYDMTRSAMEILKRYHRGHVYQKNLYDDDRWINETQNYIQRLLVAHEYRCFLEVATTDETLQNAKRKRINKFEPKHPIADRPFNPSVAWEEIQAYLGDGKPGDIQLTEVPDFLARARMRVRRIIDRRQREVIWRTQRLSRKARTQLFAQARRRKKLEKPEWEAMRLAAKKEIRYADELVAFEDALNVDEFQKVLKENSKAKAPDPLEEPMNVAFVNSPEKSNPEISHGR